MPRLNYEFSIRDINATKAKHAKTMSKLRKWQRENNIRLIDDLIGADYYNLNGGYYVDHVLRKFNDDKTQKNLKELKTIVNHSVRADLVNILKYNELPASWATALYCNHYGQINKYMKRILKNYA